jgi:hypothetical protein
MQTDNPLVRDGYTCPSCLGPKNRGLLICWPCHHDQKQHNDGKYDQLTEAMISAYEIHLKCEIYLAKVTHEQARKNHSEGSTE